MKKICLILAILMASVLMAGCGKKFKNGEVVVYNWGEYIDLSVIEEFEKEYDIDVIYDEFTENEDMYPIIKVGEVNYDVVCPSDYMINRMIKEDLLAELDYSNIPNAKNIDPEYMLSASEFDPGNKYAVPYCWGTVGILYNKTKVTEPITSWSSIFDPKYNQEILMIDSVRDGMGIALKYLGYSMNTQNEAELEEAKQLLSKQNKIVQGYFVDEVRNKMIGDEAILGVIYSGEALYTKRENSNLEYVVPDEGSNVWIDGWVIPKKAENKANAEKWIDFMCRGDIAYKNFQEITYSTPNMEARKLITDEDIKNSKVAFPDETILHRCETFEYLGDETEAKYLEMWNEMKAKQGE